MEKALFVEKTVIPLNTEIIQVVKDQCPLTTETLKEFNIKHCLSCPYLIQKEGVISHGWYEYKTAIKERIKTKRNDPLADYYMTIACANCGFDVPFYSIRCVFISGDKKKCPKCGLRHTFLRYEETKENSILVFAIPVKAWEKRQKQKQ